MKLENYFQIFFSVPDVLVVTSSIRSPAMAVGEVTVAQDGGQGNVKLHPYLVALVRWCVSCVWSTATLVLHRLITGSVPIAPSIAGFTARPVQKTRVASKEHLHPEPRVECEVLHQPQHHSLDVIFVHGLYGSLGNTWRQGDWRSKYKLGPNIIPLLRPKSCTCEVRSNEGECKTNETTYEFKINDMTYDDLEGNFYSGIKNITTDEDFIAEKFYNSPLLDQVEMVDNFETQAKFVRDLFENRNCENTESRLDFECKINEARTMECQVNEAEMQCQVNAIEMEYKEDVDCECKVNVNRKCEVGCGCVCDVCYSSCWPRDWIREDYPDARVISINYTSDPYLWRPLWIKECKRLHLHERAEQMSKQLLELGVGEKPVIWVGHSKGGLFIKQIYCEAYEAYIKRAKAPASNEGINVTRKQIDDENNIVNKETRFNKDNALRIAPNYENGCGDKLNERCRDSNHVTSSDCEEDQYETKQANLWRRSAGFMFYSVPHRGSPLADIKTPITARSIELLEISKDNSLVLSLQDRWLKATQSSKPQVRSLVETCRTLMSVLWLRIVSVPSADAGIGALYGVSVDHREICKPSSRSCLLYKELMALMRASLNQCRCDI